MSLKFLEVVVKPIQSIVQCLLVLGQPLVKRLKPRRLEAVQPVPPLRPAADETHFVEHAQMLRDLRLGQREVVHDRPDRLLAADQHVQDLAAVRVPDRVEDI